MNWREHITVDPMICHGQPCIKGTRVLVSVILDNLAARVPAQEIIATYPGVTHRDIDAVLAYAAELARERLVGLPS
ncbi:MAG: DUF433 domain-containing protein [Chloroflexi bacterium]|nr:DUF433 domain-containing protein [Chloroflexota bacterium]